MRRFLTLAVGVITTLALAVPGVQLLSTTAANATATTGGALGATPASSWQANATVWKMAFGHGDVWMVGDFTTLRPPGVAAGTAADVPTNFFGALVAATGAPDTAVKVNHTFTGQPAGTLPLTNGTVATSPDGNTVYVGGAFTQVDGVARNHLAAFNAANGALLSWNPNVGAKVSAIATSGDVVYIGGSFGKVGTTTTGSDIAAVSATTGKALPWGTPQPSMDNSVDALAVTADGTQVVAGGFFDKVDGLTQSADGSTQYNKAVIIGGIASSTPGALEPMPADGTAVPFGTPSNNTGCVSNVKDIDISGGVAYIADEGTGGGCFDGTWAVNVSDGSLVWVNRCLGATQVVQVVGSYLYKGSHAHDCQEDNTNGPVSNDPANYPQVADSQARHLLSENLSDGFLGPFYPDVNAGPNLGPRTMTTDGTQLYVGGDFTSANHVNQQAILRFSPTKDYPTPKPAPPVAVPSASGSVNVYAQAPIDLDDPALTLELFRDGGKTPIATTNVTSYFWKQPVIGFTDTGLTVGSTHSYTVQAFETNGTSSSPLSGASAKVTITNGSTGYAATVLGQNPAGYWRFGEPSGTVSADSSSNLNGGAYTGVTLGQPGGIVGDSNTAASFNGTTSFFSSGTPQPSPTTFSAEAWFKTTTTAGGKIIGFGNASTSDSTSYDKHVYMTNAGKLIFGTYNNGPDVIQTGKSFNDGAWHQVVATQGAGGMSLYVDGVKVGSNPTTTNQSYNGFWRVGEDNLNGWPSIPSSFFFQGSIDDASVYNAALTPAQVAAQYTAAGYNLPVVPGANTPYAKTVIADSPSLYWRLDEASGQQNALDLSGNGDNGSYGTGDTLGAPGGISDGSSPADTAIRTDGTDNGRLVAQSQSASPTAFSAEAWFKTSVAAGKLIGFGDSSTQGGSASNDKHVYFDGGNLNFGVWNGHMDIISTSAAPLINGQWHHVVASQDGSGMKLYVDGSLVASGPVTTNQVYNGYWHVGGDTGWGAISDFTGSIDEVAVYPYALTLGQVQNDFAVGTGSSSTPTPPAAPAKPSVTSSSPTTADVSWTAVPGATSYQVQRSAAGANNFLVVGSNVVGTTFHDTGLTAGGSYDYEVVATNAGGNSGASAIATVTTAPAAPGLLSATAKSTSEIDLNWSAATGATSYDVKRGPGGSGTFPTDLGPVTTTSFADTGHSAGDSFDYEVIPSDSAGTGAASNTATGTTLPAAVTNLTATAQSATEIDLTWDSAAGAATYLVQRAPHGTTNWSNVSTGSAATSLSDTTVNPNTSYDYQVAAVNAGGTGAFSATKSATTPAVAPGQVTGLKATATSSSEIDLTWTATAGASTYEVDRSATSATAGFTTLSSTVTSASFADTTAAPQTTYWYHVIASNSAGHGAASDPATATTPSANAATLANSFEGGTAGTALTAANSGGNSGSKLDSVNCTGGTTTYVNAPPSAHGALSAALTPGTSPCYLQWGKASITSPATTSYGRTYLQLGANPAAPLELAHLGDAAFSRDAQINLAANGKLSLVDAANTKQVTFTQALPLHTWVRIEWTLVNSSTAGSFQVSVYAGDSTTPLESHTVNNINTGSSFGSLQLGQVLTSATAPGTLLLDDVAYGTAGPLGPSK